MKTKNRKLHRIISVLLCVVMLIGLMPVQTAVALAEESAESVDYVKYQKILGTDEIVEGGTYVITYKDPSPTDASPDSLLYALSTDVDPGDAKIGYPAEITLRSNGDLLVDPNSNYVFTAEKLEDGTGNPRLKANNGNYLRIESGGMFGSGSTYITLTYDGASGYWSVRKAEGRSLTFNGETFGMTSGSSAAAPIEFEIWKPAPSSSDYIKLNSIDQLADFKDDTEFVIVLETEDSHAENQTDLMYKAGLKAIGSGNNWRYSVKTFTDVDGTEYISVDDTYPVVFNFHGAFTSGTVNKVKYCGFDNDGIRLTDGYSYFYPQNASNNYNPFRSKGSENNTVHFEYGTGNEPGNYSDKIYIRGNGNSTYLGIEKGEYTGKLAQNSEYRIPVQIYVAVSKTAVRVEYLNANDEVSRIAYAEKDGTLTLMTNVKDEEHNGYTYAFVGWTMTKPEDPFLSLDDSCNIFNYDNETDSAHILDSIKDKYGLIGDCNPDYSNAQINLQEIDVEAGETLQLYPIYAVRGFDTVVTALEADGTKILGVSDWKADPSQGLDSFYEGGEREKWLGYIDVQIYRDGVEWVAPTRLYYRYHNDNTADLSIKFIWDELLESEEYKDPNEDPNKKLSPLYLYMSDHEQFPLYDQSGHYVIDAVYAKQGGSEDGLKYSLNWMTDHGGQLDNVGGGTLVQVFVSTKYDVKYYLDDEEITESSWAKHNEIYTTPGTEELFNTIDVAEFISEDGRIYKYAENEDGELVLVEVNRVRSDNALNGLMDRDIVEDEDPDKEIEYAYSTKQATDENGELLYDEEGNPIYEILLDDYGNPVIVYNPHEWFLEKDGGEKRGEPEFFSYVMHEYRHDIPLAKSPEELVPEGKSLISKMWSLKDESLVFQSAHEWSSGYVLKGDEHGTGNTAASYFDGIATFAADDPYTFHFYAYTGEPGDLTVSKTVTGNEGETDKDFNFTVTIESSDAFDADDINGQFGDMEFTKGVAEFTLKHGESKTAEGLPAGVTYTVTEAEANEDGYTTTATADTGTIEAYATVVIEFVNDRNVEEPTTEEPTTEEPTTEEPTTEEPTTEEPTTEEPTTEEPTTEEPTTEEPTTEEPTTEEPTTEEPTTQPSTPAEKAPKTGDYNYLGTLVLFMIVSFLGMVFCFAYSKKKAKNVK